MQRNLAAIVREVVVDLFLEGDRSIPLAPDLDLIESGITDSMGLVRIAAALESRFPGVRIQDQDVTRDNLGSISAIAAFISRTEPV
jgi:acyl carrier protein